MAGLTGLNKKPEPTEQDKMLDAFISGAEKRVKALESSEKIYSLHFFSQ
jgi:hypothetical protein